MYLDGENLVFSYKPVWTSQMSHKAVTVSPPWPNTDRKLWTRNSDYSWIDSDLWVQVARASLTEVMHAQHSDESCDAQEENTASLVGVVRRPCDQYIDRLRINPQSQLIVDHV